MANWTLATGGNGNVCSFSSSLPLNNETETPVSIQMLNTQSSSLHHSPSPSSHSSSSLHHSPSPPPLTLLPLSPSLSFSNSLHWPLPLFPHQFPSPSHCHPPFPLSFPPTYLFLESILVRFTSFPLTLLFKLDILFESLLPMEPFLLPSLLSSPPGRGGVRKKSGSNSCCTPSSGSASN